MKTIVVTLTMDELKHVTQLMGKDIGWHQKHGNPDKAEEAREIYIKLARVYREQGGE